ncbi:MAG TPA: hypothetical protein VKX35_02675 [Fermentimonas sp.]|nr:hypothetical protein [Fermentimonas sp.]
MWIITNIDIDQHKDLKSIKCNNFAVYADKEIGYDEQFSTYLIFEGYVLGRMSYDSSLDDQGLHRLVASDKEFIHKVKGNFSIVKFSIDNFEVYGDRFGINKWFYYSDQGKFIISDSLDEIVKVIKPDVSQESMAAYALTYHFSAGLTLYENVYHNKPAQKIIYEDGSLKIDSYWDPNSLLRMSKESFDIEDIVFTLSSHIDQLLKISPTDKISLSLTGGADTRNLLALMLSKDIKPHLYTYGNPESADCVKARTIAQGLDLDHSIHDIKMTVDLFKTYAAEIVKWGQSLTSIHRVHRIIAVEREKEFAERMFLGSLGGEFVKGVSEDDYIVPKIVYDNWGIDRLSDRSVSNYCQAKSLRTENLDTRKISDILNPELFQGNVIEKKFNALVNITAHLHDAQDIVIYHSAMKSVFTPFLDIDYLELLFSSRFTFNNKEVINNRLLRRVQNPVYCSSFIQEAYPRLGKFRYSGEHKPNEVILNPYIAALLKGIRQKLARNYPPNFPLTNWMREFVIQELPKCYDYEKIRSTFKIELLIKELETREIEPKEAAWLKYTNPINMMYIINNIG